jgi:hypothetical protein
MTDGGAGFQPGAEETRIPFRARGAYAGFRAFGSGDGAVLVEPQVARRLRSAAEFATQEGRIAGGLLYGHGWEDEQGSYLVIDGYLEAGPGENRDRIAADGTDEFTLSAADLRLLREDGARMYSDALESGWWRTLPALGEFSPRDFETQAELVGPDGVGLLVYGSGVHWGTAYLGPDGHAPDSAGTLVTVPEAAPGPPPAPVQGPAPVPDPAGVLGPDPGTAAEAGLAPEPGLVDIAAGESLVAEQLPGDAGPTVAGPQEVPPPRRRVRRRAAASAPTAARRWAVRRAALDGPPQTPADVQFVVGALIAVTIAVAIIVGVLASSLLVALIIAVVGSLLVLSTVWIQRR